MNQLTAFLLIALMIICGISCSDNKTDNDKQQDNMQAEHKNNQSNNTPDPSRYLYPDNNGIGPIREISLDAIDNNLAGEGKTIFNTKCISCHQLDARNVGPALRNITRKNTPVYIMNYLLNTMEMQRKDPLMMKMVDEYKVIMPDQQLTRDDARAVLEYFRSVEN